MPFPKNTVSVFNAKIKEVTTRYTQENKQITNVRCYEYQGSKNDKPEGLTWNLELWEKTSEFFLEKNPEPNTDYIAFSGSIIDKSFDGDDGKRVYRQSLRVNNIEILKPREPKEGGYTTGGGGSNYSAPAAAAAPPANRQPLPAEHAAYLQQFIALNGIPAAKALQITGGRGANQLYADEYTNVLAALTAAISAAAPATEAMPS